MADLETLDGQIHARDSAGRLWLWTSTGWRVTGVGAKALITGSSRVLALGTDGKPRVWNGATWRTYNLFFSALRAVGSAAYASNIFGEQYYFDLEWKLM